MMRASPALSWIAVVAFVLTGISCAAYNARQSDFSIFLNQLAKDCKPLIIGSDDMGMAIIFNGTGAQPENWNNFLGKTQALYSGAIPPEIYRDSLTAFIGSGSYNAASYACIIAHVPKR